MKQLIKLIVIALVAVSLCSCGDSYSPLDTYVNGLVKSDSLNKVSKIEG